MPEQCSSAEFRPFLLSIGIGALESTAHVLSEVSSNIASEVKKHLLGFLNLIFHHENVESVGNLSK